MGLNSERAAPPPLPLRIEETPSIHTAYASTSLQWTTFSTTVGQPNLFHEWRCVELAEVMGCGRLGADVEFEPTIPAYESANVAVGSLATDAFRASDDQCPLCAESDHSRHE